MTMTRILPFSFAEVLAGRRWTASSNLYWRDERRALRSTRRAIFFRFAGFL
jgi:hypothetical protein